MVTAGFVAPYLLDTTMRFVEAAASLPDTRLALITTEPEDRLPPQLRRGLAGHWRVEDPLDAGQIAWAVEGLGEQVGPVRAAALAVARDRRTVGRGEGHAASLRDKWPVSQGHLKPTQTGHFRWFAPWPSPSPSIATPNRR